MKDRVWWEWTLVGLLFAAALAVRVYRLDEIPTGLFNDEAANGIDVREILAGHHAIFFERNSGREPFFLYVQALVTSVVGLTPFGLRLSAALLGALTVPATYGMVRTLFAGYTAHTRVWALYSAVLVAFGYWHLSLSRLGFRAISFPLVVALTFIFLGRAWNRLPRDDRFPYTDSLLAGLFLGGSLYTYAAARFFPIAVGSVLLIAMSLRQQRSQRSRMAAMSGLVIAAALVTFTPLGLYFLRHPESFLGRAQTVSILATAYGGPNPLSALGRSTVDTLLMFWTEADPNLRHNPAQRPVFEILLSIWLLAGFVIALRHWRMFPFLLLLVTTVVHAFPALLTAEGTPHSLRAAGMIPAVYVLPVLGMLAAGRWLFPRRQRWIALLPLPFVIYSALIGTNSYFRAWQNPEQFRMAFLPDYMRLAHQMSQYGDEDAVWILPLSPAYYPRDYEFFTVGFFYAGEAGYADIFVDPEVVSAQLADAVRGRQQAYLVQADDMDGYAQAEYLLGDPKKLLPFLLRKYGTHVAAYEEPDIGVPFDVYQLPPSSDYALINVWTPQATVFDDKVELVGVDFGGVPVGEHPNQRVTSTGAPMWVALQWKALTPIDIDLKVGLTLKDQAGRVVGQVDDLLVGDRYPVDRVWAQGDLTETYHILPTLPALAPGTYDLMVRVYEDQSLRVYPVLDQGHAVAGVDALLAAVPMQKSAASAVVTPTQTLDAGQLTPDLALLGYDLTGREVRPGDTLGLTLFWQAARQPMQDYTIRLALESRDGESIAVRTTQPVDGTYPTQQWAAGEVVRDMHDLAIPAMTEGDAYPLVLTVESETKEEMARRVLGEIVVAGLSRQFERPEPSQDITAAFGQFVNLAGLDTAGGLRAHAGEPVTFDLLWEVTGRPPTSLVRFVHVLDAENRLVAQQDTVPCDGMCPVTGWVVGEFLRDRATITLPEDLSPGRYSLIVGWYEADGGVRLPVVDGHGATLDAYPLLPIDLEVISR